MQNNCLGIYDLVKSKITENQKIIMVDENNQYECYAALRIIEMADLFEDILTDQGVEMQEIITVIPNNSITSISIFLGSAKAGMISAFVPIKLNPFEIKSIIESTGSKLCICSNDYKYKDVLIELLSDSSKVVFYNDTYIEYTFKQIRRNRSLRPFVQVDPKRPVSIMFTSGSTQVPKGVVLAQNSYTLNAFQIGSHIKINSNDVYMQVLPFYYIAGQVTAVMAPLLHGINLIICKQPSPQSVLFCIETLKPTLSNVVPTLLYRIHAYINDNHIKFLPASHNLRLCLTGGAECSQDLMNTFDKKYGIRILQGYGSTEAGCGICINPIESPKEGSVGIPLPENHIKVVREEGAEYEKTDGRIGKIYIKNDVSMLHYFNHQDNAKFIDGWFVSGDLGYLEEGYLFLIGRETELIKRGGEKIYLKELEDTIRQCKNVIDCKVISVVNEEFGEIPVAFVVLQNNKNSEGLFGWISANISKYKRPEVIIIDNLPLTSSEKVSTYKLKEYYFQNKERTSHEFQHCGK